MRKLGMAPTHDLCSIFHAVLMLKNSLEYYINDMKMASSSIISTARYLNTE